MALKIKAKGLAIGGGNHIDGGAYNYHRRGGEVYPRDLKISNHQQRLWLAASLATGTGIQGKLFF